MSAGGAVETVFLLNPPFGFKLHRDFYCCAASKTGYLWHPIDLLVQAAILSGARRVELCDAVAEGIGAAETVRRAVECRPRLVYSLVGSLSERSDFALLEEIKSKTGAAVVVSGDIALEPPEELRSRAPWLDGALRDFTSRAVEDFLDGKMNAFAPSAPGDREFSYPVPQRPLLPAGRYSLPFAGSRFATVLASFGCPHKCMFCNSGAESLGFRHRGFDNLAEEIIRVKQSGIEHIFFKDMTFGADRKRREAICALLSKEAPGVGWQAYTRLDLIDEETVRMYRAAGCRLLQIGIESADANITKSMKKGCGADRAGEVFALLKRHGIAAGAHYILGLPGASSVDDLKTVSFALRLDSAYASFNAFRPRPGAALGAAGDGKNAFAKGTLLRFAYILFYFNPLFVLRKLFARNRRETAAGSARSLVCLFRYLLALPDLRKD